MYFQDDIQDKLKRVGRNQLEYPIFSEDTVSVFRNIGKPTGAGKLCKLSQENLQKAHLYALTNCTEVEQFFSHFDAQHCHGLTTYQTQQVRAAQFPAWFYSVVHDKNMINQVSQSLQSLARGPTSTTTKYKGYIVNGFRFHIMNHGRGPSNSGVCVRGVNGVDADPSNYYGKLQAIYEIEYSWGFSVFFFKCKWYNTDINDGVWNCQEYGLVEVNPERELQTDEPFSLASQATQVYYTINPGNHLRTLRGRRGWESVVSTRARHVIQGFTLTADPPTDDEAEDNNDPPREYQDNTVPPLNPAPRQTTDEHIALGTGRATVDESESDEEGPSHTNNEEDGLEYFSQDEYPEEE